MTRTVVSLALVAVVVALAGCGGDDEQTATTTAAATCRSVEQPDAKANARIRRPTRRLAPSATWRATVRTNCGSFTITLDVDGSPRTTASFVHLARAGFYDGLTFHRIAPGFVIQGGDPTGAGYGGPGYTIKEPPPAGTRYVHGTVAMAKRGTEPDGTSGSQFFIVTADDAGLPPQYAVLGQVTEGLDVVELIEQRPLRTNDPQGSAPVDPVVIEEVVIEQG